MAESVTENQLIGGPFVGEIDYNEIEKIMVNFYWNFYWNFD